MRGGAQVRSGSLRYTNSLLASSRTILVTGASGFVGRAVVAALADSGAHVRALSRNPLASIWNNARVTPVRGDLHDRRALDEALDGVAAAVHLAGVLAGPVEAVRRVNVEGTASFARAARAARVPLVIHGSSAGVYGDGDGWTPHTEHTSPSPETPYERSKLEGEIALRETLGDVVPWIVLRPAGVHGPGRPATLDFYRQVLRRRVWTHGPTVQLMHPTAADDVVAAVLAAVERPELGGQIFNIGGERALPYIELIALVARYLGTHVLQPRLPSIARDVARAVISAGVQSSLIRRLSREVVNRSVDTTAARHALGFRPVALEDAIAHNVAAFRRKGLL